MIHCMHCALWHVFIYQVRFCPPYNCTIIIKGTSLCLEIVVHGVEVYFWSFINTCYLGILGLEGAINCILARTFHQRTTSEKRTKALLPKCPLFGGSTVSHKEITTPTHSPVSVVYSCSFHKQLMSTSSTAWKWATLFGKSVIILKKSSGMLKQLRLKEVAICHNTKLYIAITWFLQMALLTCDVHLWQYIPWQQTCDNLANVSVPHLAVFMCEPHTVCAWVVSIGDSIL